MHLSTAETGVIRNFASIFSLTFISPLPYSTFHHLKFEVAMMCSSPTDQNVKRT